MLLVAVFSLMTFSACDSDTTTRWELEGEWWGNFAMYLSIGRKDLKAKETYIFFDKNRTGSQTDYYEDGLTVTNLFTWNVIDGTIKMHYTSGIMCGQKVEISNYALHNRFWTGIVEGHDFRMYKEASEYEDYYYDYYYAKQRNNTSLQSAEEE